MFNLVKIRPRFGRRGTPWFAKRLFVTVHSIQTVALQGCHAAPTRDILGRIGISLFASCLPLSMLDPHRAVNAAI